MDSKILDILIKKSIKEYLFFFEAELKLKNYPKKDIELFKKFFLTGFFKGSELSNFLRDRNLKLCMELKDYEI